MKRVLLASVLALASASAQALDVFACEPEWAALVRELAGDTVQVSVATTAFQDAHRVQARPSLIAQARQAQLLVCTGAELEVGWLPLLLRRAANPRIQPGSPGHFMAADFVRKIEVPLRLDRSEGDVHPQGNPHVHLNPRNISRVAKQLGQRLAQIDAAGSAGYRERTEVFLARWSAAVDNWELRAAPLAGTRLVAYHRSFSYLADWLDLQIVATLESKPGIPPSGAHLAALLEQLTPASPTAIILTPYENEKPAQWLSRKLGSPAVVLPYTVGGDDPVTDLFSLFEQTLAQLEALPQ